MKHPLLLLGLLLWTVASPAHGGLLDDLTAGNIGATNATVSFASTDKSGTEIPSTALLEWGGSPKFGSRVSLQHNSSLKPPTTDGPVAGLRCLYIDGLAPATTYHWKITVTAAGGAKEEGRGKFTTLTVDASRKRGPDGTHVPPHTPAYAKPATHTARSWAEVNALLGRCRGGEVIEVVGDVHESMVVLTGGSEDWPVNVLIRPRLGHRAASRVAGIEINSPHITVAGFNLNNAFMYPKYGRHPGNARSIGARRAFFWMCTIDRHGTLLANGCPDSGWYEVVAPARGVGGDRAQIKTFADIVPSHFTIAGCWLEGKDRTNQTDHSDTLQTLGDGQTITGLKLINTVFFRSANCSGQLTHLSGALIENCWFAPLQVKSKVCGSHYATLGGCEKAVIRNSDWNGSFRQDAEPDEITNSRFPKLAQPGKIFKGNTVGGGLAPQPAFPDLAKIWPR